ncbi:MAG: RlmE family RNA methyltransferase [Bdellovibrionales bacterium]|nr:RlmE family RNA methyltransferase [Bdellovibrionales bacterium]
MPGKYNRKDHFYKAAKSEGFRSRAAYKLIELNQKAKVLRKGAAVLDLGAAPGGWLQVAAMAVGSGGRVFGVDLEPIPPFSPAELKPGSAVPVTIQGDITSEAVRQQLVQRAGGQYDVVLSDMSPKLSGIRDRDIAMSVELIAMAQDVCCALLRPGGVMLAKVFPSNDTEELIKSLRDSYRRIERVHPKSSRKTSRELYIVCRGFVPTREEAS